MPCRTANPDQRMETQPPSIDLLSWVFGNDDVPEDRPIFIDAKDPWSVLTKQDTRHLTRRFVAGWKRHVKVQRNFTACIHMFNCKVYPALIYGIVGAGGCFTGTNPAYAASELDHHFRIANVSFVITERSLLSRVLEAAKARKIAASNVFVFDADREAGTLPAAVHHLDDLLNHGEEDWNTIHGDEAKSTPVGLFSTSGTSGLPRLAIRTHYNFVAENLAIKDPIEKPYHVSTLLCVPFFHAFAAPLCLVSALREGKPTYVMRRFHDVDFRNAVFEHTITETALPSPVLITCLSVLSTSERRQLKSIQLVHCGGAPLDRAIQLQARKLFSPSVRIVQVWGMTEAGWISTFHYPESDETGSVGRLLPGIEAKIIDLEGTNEALPSQVTGELVIRGPTIMPSYLNNDEATAKGFTADGWLRTGDVGRIDPSGKIYLSDRIKDLIKLRGWQISPSEIEGALLQHPRVVDAAVVGIPVACRLDTQPACAYQPTDEIPRAYVVGSEASALSPTFGPNEDADVLDSARSSRREDTKDVVGRGNQEDGEVKVNGNHQNDHDDMDGQEPLEQQIKTFLSHRLARYKTSDLELVVCDVIPRSATGKILRRDIKAEALAGRLAGEGRP